MISPSRAAPTDLFTPARAGSEQIRSGLNAGVVGASVTVAHDATRKNAQFTGGEVKCEDKQLGARLNQHTSDKVRAIDHKWV